MRCRECGLELDERDRLRNGAYQCPECGAIYHTASSSRVSPSPYRRRRRNPFGSFLDALTERRFGLPLWAWIAAAAVVLILALILIFNLIGGRGSAADDTGSSGSQAVEATDEPGVPLDQPLSDAGDADGAIETAPAAPETTPIAINSSSNLTGVRLNDFTVGFDWAMSKLKYSESLTLQSSDTSTSGDMVNTYSFQDWYSLQLVLVPDSEVIRSGTATVQLEVGSADNTRALGALAATMYALDNTITPSYARTQLSKMVTNNTEYCDRTGFSAKLTTTTDKEYVMELSGKL